MGSFKEVFSPLFTNRPNGHYGISGHHSPNLEKYMDEFFPMVFGKTK
jgi:hypothetical protein